MIDEWIDRLENELKLIRIGMYGDDLVIMRFTHRDIHELLQFLKAYKEAEVKHGDSEQLHL